MCERGGSEPPVGQSTHAEVTNCDLQAASLGSSEFPLGLYIPTLPVYAHMWTEMAEPQRTVAKGRHQAQPPALLPVCSAQPCMSSRGAAGTLLPSQLRGDTASSVSPTT